MQLKDLEEKSFIRNVLGRFASTARMDKFDDCIAVDLGDFTGNPDSPYLVYSIDHPSFIKRTDDRDENHRFYGRWAAACTCGDVLAMGAIPKGFSLDLSAPLETEVSDIVAIMEGIGQTLASYGIEFEGGNFDANHLELVCMAWGIVAKNNIVRRAGARPGDIVAATGLLGQGWSGMVAQKKGLLDALSEESRQFISTYKLTPLAPVKAMLEVFEASAITSGMDLSDGLVEFMYTVSERNGLGVEVKLENLPVSPVMKEAADLLQIDARLFALEPGYDTPITHGWTVKPEMWPLVQEIFSKHGQPIHAYGIVTEEPGVRLIHEDNRSVPIPPFWDDQFRKESTVNRWLDFIGQLSGKSVGV